MGLEPDVSLDISGGADYFTDEVTAEVPTSASYREGVSFWFWDESGRFCFPRVGVEAVGATWESYFETALCVARPDGRLLIALSEDPPVPTLNGDGRPRVLGAGPLRFECLEPFSRWRIDFRGRAISTTVGEYLAGGVAKPRVGTGFAEVQIALSVNARMVAPPWFQGTRAPEGHQVRGELRFEQLCVVTGSMTVDGNSTDFSGEGLRVHRKGGDRNDYGDFFGHNWQSAMFPSGRAFGFIHYRPGPDEKVKYREGWVLDGGAVLAARVEGTPWMVGTQPSGEDVSFTLCTVNGDVDIQGTTFASSFRPPRPTTAGTTFPLLQSGIARYRWGEEEAYGMIERSARIDIVTPN